jgi:hypothetical protein
MKGTATWKSESFKISYKDKAKTVTKILKKLRSGKIYQIKIGAYVKIKSGTSKGSYYSTWTKVKNSKKIGG